MDHLLDIKEDICKVGRKLYEFGFNITSEGNISVRISDDKILITPSGVSKGELTSDMLVKVDLNNNVLEGHRKPSSEVKMHLEIYRQRLDIKAVIHTHAPMATAFSICRKPLDKNYLPEGIVGLGVVPIADYATPSTSEVPKSILPFIKDYNAVLLANHGPLTWDTTLQGALFKMETVEYMAKMYINVAKIGGAVELDEKEVARLINLS